MPKTRRQGRVPAEDWETGRALEGYWCNAGLLGRFGPEEQGGAGSAATRSRQRTIA